MAKNLAPAVAIAALLLLTACGRPCNCEQCAEDCPPAANAGDPKSLTSHTEPPIIIGKGNSLVWTVLLENRDKKLGIDDNVRVFNGAACASDLAVLNDAVYGKRGARYAWAFTTTGLARDWKTEPFVIKGKYQSDTYELTMQFKPGGNEFKLTKNGTTCSLGPRGDGDPEADLPLEFRYLDDPVRFKGSDVVEDMTFLNNSTH